MFINENVNSSLINECVICPKHSRETRSNDRVLAIEPELAAGLGHSSEQDSG